MPNHDILIVGAGLAGLGCAVELHRSGVSCLVLEASDGVGGRVRTDVEDGFRFDRGFQVLLEGYPECRRVLDYEALDLRAFYPGSEVWTGDGFERVTDPFRRPQDALATLRTSIGTLSDKLRVGRLRTDVLKGTPDSQLRGPDRTTLEELEARGFSRGMIDGFFRPFLGGVLLNRDLTDTSRIFRYVFRMFSDGETSVPRKGMGEIPRQLAGRLPESWIRLNSPVAAVEPGHLTLDDGAELRGEAVVVATEGPAASRLLQGLVEPASKATTCMYFDAPEPPVHRPVLLLDGKGTGPVNNLAVLSQVSPDYAPEGRHLVATSLVGIPSLDNEGLEGAVRRQMEEWFGSQVRDWRLLRTYRIAHAQPAQDPGALDPPQREVRLAHGLFICGDHRETASLQGALHSGRRAAEAVLEASRAGA